MLCFDDDDDDVVRQDHKIYMIHSIEQRAGCIRRSLDGFVLLVISLNLTDGPTILEQHTTYLMQ